MSSNYILLNMANIETSDLTSHFLHYQFYFIANVYFRHFICDLWLAVVLLSEFETLSRLKCDGWTDIEGTKLR